MTDDPIYHICKYNHAPFIGRNCPECHREASRRYRNQHKRPKARSFKFEFYPIRWEGNPAFIPEPVKREPCIVLVNEDGSAKGRNGNDYCYIWIRDRYYPLWQLLYFAVKNEEPPRYVLHWCSRRYCVNLNHLHHPQPRLAQTYRRKEVQGTINPAFPFTLRQWLDYKTKQLFKEAQPQPTADSYLEAVRDLQCAYERVRGESLE